MVLELAIFDLDDTLISTEEIYNNARHEAALILESCGVNYDLARATMVEVDSHLLRHMGVSKERLPQCFVESYETLAQLKGIKIRKDVKNRLRDTANNVFTTKAHTFENSEKVLGSLRKVIPNMCVLTRGDKHIQTNRVLQSGLIDYFDEVFVVDYKTPDYYKRLTSFYGVHPETSLMVGNSIYGDIYPALEAGLFGFYVKNGTYEMEAPYPISPEHHARMAIGPDITSLLTYLQGEMVNAKEVA